MRIKYQLLFILFLFDLVCFSQSTLIEIHQKRIEEMQNNFREFIKEIQEGYGRMEDPRQVLLMKVENEDKYITDEVENDNIPDIYPVEGTPEISSSFGYRTDPFNGKQTFHEGIDIPVSEDKDVVSCAAGKVITSDYNKINGNYIIVSHNKKYKTCYGHLSSCLVKKDDKVRKGQVIGKSGNTGLSTGPHIHYQIILNGKSIDPLSIINP